jgi:transposase
MKRKVFSAEFKAKVAMAAIKDDTTIAEISKKYEVHPTQISNWKATAIEHFADMFGDEKNRQKSGFAG